ncbi:diguanylate phosphodiesterase [Massilia sp. WF1]|uniref:EAL and HDOD domain-containing protein n=1 Tax=unclassified Massilia TaxID=2609279 RepID=UPI00064B034C|nr:MULTISPECIES: EAL domain-containing protein [unclassified Massilia]ALK95712.1 diguanylate phosphodiesterase [Massilia sp. WG5]KLU34866.1 diguanylate phosphodiesterase [Massilia sp. WF1]
MTETPRQEQADHPLRVRDFYLGRQPVLDRNQSLFGYELLFRSAPLGQANIGQGTMVAGAPAATAPSPGLNATAAVIAHAAQLGLARAIGDAHCFLNVDTDVLGSDIFAFLPRERTVLELAASVAPDEAMLARLAELAGHGFQFALDGIGSSTAAADSDNAGRLQKLLPLARFVKLDLRTTAQPTLAALVARLHGMGKTVVADKVETREEYQACLELGIDYFQGYYFAHPSVLGGRKLSPSQLAVMNLMNLIISDVDNADIERAVKRDVTVAMNLLRLVNTPAVGARQRIDSVSQALLVLGRRQLQRWLQIMLYAEPGTRGHNQTPLLMLATTRGRLMELLAQRLRPGQRYLSEIAFTVGIMSLMDVLFGIPMADIVEQIPVSDEIRNALLRRGGFFGELLKLAECIEQPDQQDEGALPALRGLAISGDDMVELEMSAFQWSDSVVRYAI